MSSRTGQPPSSDQTVPLHVRQVATIDIERAAEALREADGDEPVDGALGCQTAREADRVDALGHELIWRDIGPHVACGDHSAPTELWGTMPTKGTALVLRVGALKVLPEERIIDCGCIVDEAADTRLGGDLMGCLLVRQVRES